MNFKEHFEVYGAYRITAENVKTGEKTHYFYKNVLTQPLYTALFSFFDYGTLTPDADSLHINYFAYGDDDTAAIRANTTLGNELLRKAPSTVSYNNNIFTIKTIIDTGEGNPVGGRIKEVSVFANGTASADSGLLVSRSVVDIQKNDNIRLLVNWTFNT